MEYVRSITGLKPLLQSKRLQDACVARAEEGAAWIRSTAARKTGAYRAGIRVTRGRSDRDGRVLAYLEATADPVSATLEFGNRRTKAQHPLRSAIDIMQPRPTPRGDE